jgi:ketosteroid isomerase-like protein
MRRSIRVLAAASAVGATLLGCAATDSANAHRAADRGQSVEHAHTSFVRAINSNDLETFLGELTEDVVFMAPNQPRLVGKAAVRPWAQGYLDAYRTQWKKTTLELVELGDWAFEQYSYESTDTPRAGGPVLRDTGKGIIVYRRGQDGVWRVARDAWNSDLPLQ